MSKVNQRLFPFTLIWFNLLTLRRLLFSKPSLLQPSPYHSSFPLGPNCPLADWPVCIQSSSRLRSALATLLVFSFGESISREYTILARLIERRKTKWELSHDSWLNCAYIRSEFEVQYVRHARTFGSSRSCSERFGDLRQVSVVPGGARNRHPRGGDARQPRGPVTECYIEIRWNSADYVRDSAEKFRRVSCRSRARTFLLILDEPVLTRRLQFKVTVGACT